MLATMIGGPATNSIVLLSSAEDSPNHDFRSLSSVILSARTHARGQALHVGAFVSETMRSKPPLGASLGAWQSQSPQSHPRGTSQRLRRPLRVVLGVMLRFTTTRGGARKAVPERRARRRVWDHFGPARYVHC